MRAYEIEEQPNARREMLAPEIDGVQRDLSVAVVCQQTDEVPGL